VRQVRGQRAPVGRPDAGAGGLLAALWLTLPAKVADE